MRRVAAGDTHRAARVTILLSPSAKENLMRVKDLCKGLALACALALLAPAARADQDIPSFKEKKDLEKKFVSRVCVAILKAAHFTGRQPSLEKYEFKEIKPGRTELRMMGSYKGAVSTKEYMAKITVFIDTLDKKNWEVLRIKYDDNNNIPYSRKKVDELIKKFNSR
jgi:hypothetical protein